MDESGKNTGDGFCLIFSIYGKYILHSSIMKKVINFLELSVTIIRIAIQHIERRIGCGKR